VSALTDENLQILPDAVIDVQTRILNGEGRFYGKRRMCEFKQKPVTEALYKPPLVARQDVLIDPSHELPPTLYRATFICFHQSHGFNDVHEE
jgi:hypothetical protein